MKHATEEQKAQAKAKREKFQKFAKEISSLSPEQRSSLASKMAGAVTVEGRQLSAFNCCLIIAQGGGSATLVGGFRQWLKHGRAVKKGQHGYCIWVPAMQKQEVQRNETNDEATQQKVNFLTAYVFDVSQTEEIKKEAA